VAGVFVETDDSSQQRQRGHFSEFETQQSKEG
jgi:hypothetical protein